MIDDATKAEALRALRQKASDLRDKVHQYARGDAARMLEEWKAEQQREAKEAAEELIRVENAIHKLEQL